ncbi:hypothetical protein K523DRAFT_421953 [Schizophyllum commune Tattone D]|nr:hypothetical protein K523DRAFT_421953 [Schizophyllum commune Tattone D]
MRERPRRRALTSDSAPYASDSARLLARTRQKHFLPGFRIPPTTPKTAFLLSTCSSKPDFKPSHEELGDFGPLDDGFELRTTSSGRRQRAPGVDNELRASTATLRPRTPISISLRIQTSADDAHSSPSLTRASLLSLALSTSRSRSRSLLLSV